jgi:hypothetical protein
VSSMGGVRTPAMLVTGHGLAVIVAGLHLGHGSAPF